MCLHRSRHLDLYLRGQAEALGEAMAAAEGLDRRRRVALGADFRAQSGLKSWRGELRGPRAALGRGARPCRGVPEACSYE